MSPKSAGPKSPGSSVSIDAPAQAREHWRKVSRLSRWTSSRRTRRTVLLFWIVIIALEIAISLTVEHYDPHSVISNTTLLFIITIYGMHWMSTGLSQPTLEDRAVMQYGEEFDALKEQQRVEVFDQQVRDNLLGRSNKDVRDIDLRTRSEATAYRLFGYALALALAACWIICGLHRFEAIHHTMLFVTIAVTWFAAIFIALPFMVRLWTEPDPNGEPHLLEPRIVKTENPPPQ